jgi:hypothetical protein
MPPGEGIEPQINADKTGSNKVHERNHQRLSVSISGSIFWISPRWLALPHVASFAVLPAFGRTASQGQCAIPFGMSFTRMTSQARPTFSISQMHQ